MAYRSVSNFRISIHALCEEGDNFLGGVCSDSQDFYPRPLRGGRRVNHDLRDVPRKFLSTPSARRATRTHRNGYRHN